MIAFRIVEFGSVDGLVPREEEVPAPGPQEVIVRIHATSLNRRDLMILNRQYPIPASAGIIPISDGAGEVVEIGSDVKRVRVSDRVAGNYFGRWKDGKLTWDLAAQQLGCTLNGMLTEYACLSEEALVQVPENISWHDAATLPCAGLTAWSALRGIQPVGPGDTVLTLGTGGVALFALQLAKALGALVISTTSSEEKAQRLKTLGADEVINYRANPEWSREVRRVTGGAGVNRVIDTGGSDTLEESIKSTAPNGEIALVTAIGRRPMIEIHPQVLASSLVTIRRLFVGPRQEFENLNRFISQHKIHPAIDRVFGFSKAKDAYRYYSVGVQHHNIFGKVVIAADG